MVLGHRACWGLGLRDSLFGRVAPFDELLSHFQSTCKISRTSSFLGNPPDGRRICKRKQKEDLTGTPFPRQGIQFDKRKRLRLYCEQWRYDSAAMLRTRSGCTSCPVRRLRRSFALEKRRARQTDGSHGWVT